MERNKRELKRTPEGVSKLIKTYTKLRVGASLTGRLDFVAL